MVSSLSCRIIMFSIFFSITSLAVFTLFCTNAGKDALRPHAHAHDKGPNTCTLVILEKFSGFAVI